MSEQITPSDSRTVSTKLQNRLAVSFATLAALVSVAAVMAVYGYASRLMRENTSARLRDIASEAALHIDGDLHATLTDPAQDGGEDYLKIKRTLQNIRDAGTKHADPKKEGTVLRFVYTMRYMGGEPPPVGDGYVIFVVDAEPAESVKFFSPLGSVYGDIDKDLLGQLYGLTEPDADKRFYTDKWGTWMSGYAPIYTSDGRIDAILGVDMSVLDVLANERRLLLLSLGLLFFTLPLTAVLGWLLGRRLASPVVALAEGARRVAAGDFSQHVSVDTGDELSQLADSFNTMTNQVQTLVSELERRVADRTRQIEERTEYLETTTRLSHSVASILDPDELMVQVVEQIHERFKLYYVGLFLVDEVRQWASLKAGTGEAGRAMLARKHQIKVGSGMVGWCIANGEARIAQLAGEDAMRLVNPELPNTLSEAALPLHSRGQVLGALTLQSDQPNAFDEQKLGVLQAMADQAAIALDNARLLAQSQAALEAERRAYGEIGQQAWRQLLRERGSGYLYKRSGERSESRDGGQAVLSPGTYPDELRVSGSAIVASQGAWRAEMKQAAQTKRAVEGEDGYLALPVTVRDQVIGVVGFRKQGGWTGDEISMLEAILTEAGEALESARLYQETQRRAARERLAADITAQMRASLDIRMVMQAAARELADKLGAAQVEVHLADVGEAVASRSEAASGDAGPEAAGDKNE